MVKGLIRPGGVVLALCASVGGVALAPAAYAGGKIEFGEGQSISVGAGTRSSFSAVEDAAPSGEDWSSDFNVDSARIYLNGSLTDIIKFELNTECVFCGNSSLSSFEVLDAIAKLEFSPEFNIWAGRLLVPADRAEMSGPYYANTYDFNRTPFYPADFSVDFGDGGAGVYGRDHGVTAWGYLGPEQRFTYAVGVFNGLEGGPNQEDEFLYGTRLAWNFLSVEKNPGYYTSSTYYGGGGDILTLAFAAQYQKEGAGTATLPADFFGWSVDLLFEKSFGTNVLTIEGEYKAFDLDGFDVAAFTDPTCFCMFEGDSYTGTMLFLIGGQGFGRFQPYVRYSSVSPDESSDRDESEVGVNYIIKGHNARISVFYEHGDIASEGLNYAPGVDGEDLGAFKIGLQVQI